MADHIDDARLHGGSHLGRLAGAVSLSILGVVAPLAAVSGQAPPDRALVDARDSTGIVTGRLVDADDDAPVPYGTVALIGTNRASFADADGAFWMARLPEGSFTLRARQIGYGPRDTLIAIGAAPARSVVVLRIRRLPALLGLVRVEAHRPKGCTSTGIPDSVADPKLAAVFAQVKENVDRYQLLLDTYPFRYALVERGILRQDPGGDPRDSTRSVDTLRYESRNHRPYRTGDIVYTSADATGRTREYMYLPTFRELADSAFLAAHCFTYGGTSPDSVSGRQLIRIDVVPARSIRTPDVRGSIYLDAQRLVVRRAAFELTNPRAVNPPVIGYTVTTTFTELVPLAPVFDSIESVQLLADGATTMLDADRRPLHREAITEDRLLAVTFEGQAPGTAVRPVTDAASGAGPPAPALTGRVVDFNGAPLQGATLVLLGTGDTLTTSSNGQFALQTMAPGAYMLSAIHIGFREVRLPVTIASQHTATLAITLQPALHVLPTVTTTGELQAGYRAVGFAQRRQAGIGQFITYDQIVRRQATEVTQLFTPLLGVAVGQAHEIGDGSQHVGSNNTLVGTRGIGSCVRISVDGVPQAVISDRDVDNLIQPSEVGAIEAYEPSEIPAGLGGETMELPQMDRAHAGGADIAPQCSLIVIWTRARLGIPGAAGQTDAALGKQTEIGNASEVVRGVASFGSDSACEPPPTTDTAELVLRAAIASLTPTPDERSNRAEYIRRVLDAIRRSFVFPTELSMPAFGLPFPTPDTVGSVGYRKNPPLDVAPALSSVVEFTLDSSGGLDRAHVTVSSLSGVADTSILVAIQRAAATHQFPSQSAGALRGFVLIVSTDEPVVGDAATVLGGIKVPVWPLVRRASAQTDADPGGARNVAVSDSLTFTFVVDEHGRPVRSTARIVNARGVDAPTATRQAKRVLQMQFQPALIGRCPVPEVLTQAFPIVPPDAP